MNELYDKLVKFRLKSYENIEKFKDDDFHAKYFEDAKDVIKQLLLIAFCNKNEPDTLPDVFYINNVHFTQFDLEYLMNDIGYKVTVDLVGANWIKGLCSFKVTIVKS